MTIPLVVGVDGSEASLEGVDWAAAEATRHGILIEKPVLLEAASTADLRRGHPSTTWCIGACSSV